MQYQSNQTLWLPTHVPLYVEGHPLPAPGHWPSARPFLLTGTCAKETQQSWELEVNSHENCKLTLRRFWGHFSWDLEVKSHEKFLLTYMRIGNKVSWELEVNKSVAVAVGWNSCGWLWGYLYKKIKPTKTFHVTCHKSHVTCNMSNVICHMLLVTCHLSLTQILAATDLPPANSLIFHSRLVC